MDLLKTTHKALNRWYAKHGRKDLPWRNTADPYAIWISETMLQQTQVKTVLERFYFPFLEKFPTIKKLAAAPADKVMKAWEGLGYYSRAGNLHKAAKILSGKKMPDTFEELIALPGIGRNTAHAILAFGFHQPVPVMEANVKRVLCRVYAMEKADDKLLWQRAHAFMDMKHPFDFNQAMMDIGATVCTKKNPACGICPLNKVCVGKSSPESFPAAKKKKTVPVRKRSIILFHNNEGRIFAEARTSRFLSGLYGFKEFEQDKPITFLNKRYGARELTKLGHITQSYSHFTLEADVFATATNATGAEFKTVAELSKLPLSRADLKALQVFTDRAGAKNL